MVSRTRPWVVGRACDEGATAVEYTILLVAVGLATVAGGPALWRGLLAVFNAILVSMGAR